MQRYCGDGLGIDWAFQSSSSPKTGCNGGDLKPADINEFNNNRRDPIIPRILTITIGSR
jgi:hypothetical protein